MSNLDNQQVPTINRAEKGRGDDGGMTTVNTNTAQQGQVQQTPQGQQPAGEQKPAYLIDWDSGITPEQAYRQGKFNKTQIMADHIRWTRDNGKDFNILDHYYGQDDDPNKTSKENEKARRNQEMQDMWEGIGNVLVSLGSFAGAAAGGPVPANGKDNYNLSERQKRLRDETLKQNRGYNHRLFEIMKQQQADEYNRKKIDLEERKQDRLDEQQRLYYRKQDWLEKYQQGLLDDKAERRRIDEEYKKGTISLKEKSNTIAEFEAFTRRMNANRAAQGSTTEIVDQYGNRKTVIKKTGTNGGAQQQSTSDEDWSQYIVK